VRKEEETCGLGRVFIRDSTRVWGVANSDSKRGSTTFSPIRREIPVAARNECREERVVEASPQSFIEEYGGTDQKIYPGGSPVPVLFRKATPSLQFARGTCTRQVNIQRVQLPLAGPCRIKVAYDREMQARFD
jgi:hypothetical protein